MVKRQRNVYIMFITVIRKFCHEIRHLIHIVIFIIYKLTDNCLEVVFLNKRTRRVSTSRSN